MQPPGVRVAAHRTVQVPRLDVDIRMPGPLSSVQASAELRAEVISCRERAILRHASTLSSLWRFLTHSIPAFTPCEGGPAGLLPVLWTLAKPSCVRRRAAREAMLPTTTPPPNAPLTPTSCAVSGPLPPECGERAQFGPGGGTARRRPTACVGLSDARSVGRKLRPSK